MEDDAMATPFCQDLKRFIMTFVSTTAEAIQATQGADAVDAFRIVVGHGVFVKNKGEVNGRTA